MGIDHASSQHQPRKLADSPASPFGQAPSHPTALCWFAFTVTGQGEITADGPVVFAPAPEGFRSAPFTVPVTGGMGSYQNARGQICVKFLGVADARFTFHLIPSRTRGGALP